MHITSITDKQSLGDYEKYRVTFSHETGDLEKTLAVGGVAFKVSPPDQWKRLRCYQLLKCIKDAERDIAYRMFGDDWREHVSNEPYFSTQASGPIKTCFLEGVALRPDLFGALD